MPGIGVARSQAYDAGDFIIAVRERCHERRFLSHRLAPSSAVFALAMALENPLVSRP